MGDRSEQSSAARKRMSAGAEGAKRRSRRALPVGAGALPAAPTIAQDTGNQFAGNQFAGADRTDPRLYYFRALLESGRFFGGGMAAMFAATGKRA